MVRGHVKPGWCFFGFLNRVAFFFRILGGGRVFKPRGGMSYLLGTCLASNDFSVKYSIISARKKSLIT